MPAMTETGPGATRATEQDQAPRWRGIFTIPVTPFGDDTEIDADSLRNQLDFCVEAGTAGIVHPVMASEFFTLTDEERLGMMPLVTRQVAGRIPVVLGVAATSTAGRPALRRRARRGGGRRDRHAALRHPLRR